MKTTVFVFAVTLLSAALAAAPAHGQQQCPIMCNAGVCNNGGSTCSTNADCIAADVAAACPCTEAANPPGVWKNHGQYVVCVVHERNKLRKEGCSITPRIASCSARSTCGKPTAVLCCKPSTGTCMIPSGSTTGTCSNNRRVTCTTDADCSLLVGPHLRMSADSCTGAGGYVSGTGSVCSGCTAPVACCVSGACQVLTQTDCDAAGGSAVSGTVPFSCQDVICP
jgi:hypothetical protein